MTLNIFAKLFLSIVAGLLALVLSIMLWVQWNFRAGFENYLAQMDERRIASVIPELIAIQRRDGNWDSLRFPGRDWPRLLHGTREPGDEPGWLDQPPPHPGGHPPRHSAPGQQPDSGISGEPIPPHPPGDPRRGPHHHPESPRDPTDLFPRVRLFDALGGQIAGAPGPMPEGAEASTYPVVDNGAKLGELVVIRPGRRFMNQLEQAFLDQQERANYWITALAVALSMLLAWLLAKQLLKPIRAITQGAASLRGGDYAVTVPVTSGDELGQLAADFNQLARTLEQNEQARRQWVADISHELRTPLAVLRGEIEAVQDGVRQFNPTWLGSLHGECLRLAKLIDDLYQLSLTDLGAMRYRMQSLDLAELLVGARDAYAPRFLAYGLTLSADLSADLRLPMMGDSDRLSQLFTNLLENSIRYTDTPGRCEIRAELNSGHAVIEIQDSAPSVPVEALDRLFERLYRVDAARGRDTGGAGLGLAICRNIVVAHNGTIGARHSALGGLAVRIELPLAKGGRST